MMPHVYIIGRDELPQAFSLGAGESLDISLVFLPGTGADVSLTVDLAGEGASALIRGLYLCPDSEKVNLSVEVCHSSGGCTSRQLLKGVVGGSARFSFHGRILVPQDSQKTKAYQENHSILLSDKALVETCPQLEIYADDVECSHGATVGSLSAEEQFYMRSRGIPEAEARRLQIISFLSPVMEGLPEGLRARIEELL